MRTRGRRLRGLLSYASVLGFIDSPLIRQTGMSAMVRVKNEEEWVEASLLSIRDAVEEIIVVDNGSTDQTPEILKRLEARLSPKMKLFFKPGLDHVDLSNFALAQTHYRWVLKWDADFVAHTTGPHRMTKLRDRIMALPQNRHFHIHLTCVELMGDLWHQCPGWETRADPFVTTYSPALQFVRVVRQMPRSELRGWPSIVRKDPNAGVTFRFEDVRLPLFFQVVEWQEPYFFHLQVKSPKRMYLRDCWSDWAENLELQKRFGCLEDYALHRAQNAWGVQTLDEAANTYMERVWSLLIPFSIERFGEHPELLRPYMETAGRKE
jgi:glycosyltransferase involved in cell wall biosynthesis